MEERLPLPLLEVPDAPDVSQPPGRLPYPPPRCSCGGHFAVDKFRLQKEHKKYKCTCDLWWFPHRIGSHKQAEAMLMRAYEDRHYGDEAAA